MLELREKIAIARERVRRLDRAETLLTAAKAAAADQRTRLCFLESRLSREERDTRRFDSMSLVALLQMYLGDAENRSRGDRRQIAAAALKCAEARASFANTEAEIADLERRIQEFAGARERWRGLAESAEIKDRDPNRRAVEAGEALGNARADIEDLSETIVIAEAAKSKLDAIAAHLATIGGWGPLDMLGTGGIMMAAVKHAKFDEARRDAQLAQQAIATLHRELADIKARLDEDGSIEPGGLTIFADYFFDGLIADWIAQSKLDRSLAALSDAREKIDVQLQRLERRREAVKRAAGRLQNDKLHIIEMA